MFVGVIRERTKKMKIIHEKLRYVYFGAVTYMRKRTGKCELCKNN